jgi:nicotinamide mononucleotide transporter
LIDAPSPGAGGRGMHETLLVEIQALSAWEAVAVLLALAYLVLVIRQNVLAWPAALASAGIYLVLMFQARLYLQSVLQLFYAGLAVYGWRLWRQGDRGGGLPVRRWAWRQHVVALAVILFSGALLGWLLDRSTDAAFPYLDAWVACGAVVTTAMVARKVLENWHYWFVIDSASIYLYASQGLWLTVGLFLVYLVLVIVGYRQWRATLEAHG